MKDNLLKFDQESKNAGHIFYTSEKERKELFRLHHDGKVSARGKTYENIFEILRDLLGTCKWKRFPETKEYITNDYFLDANSQCGRKVSIPDYEDLSGFCNKCGKEIEEVEDEETEK